MNSPLVSVIIVTWNNAIHLARCFESLVAQKSRDFEVIVIDNGSSDNTVFNLVENFQKLDLRFEKLETNHGFAFANNLGARFARGEWLATLNADAFPEPDWLEQLLSAAGTIPNAFFASRQIQVNSPTLLDGEGDNYNVSGLAWRRNYGSPIRKTTEIDEVFSSCAAAALYPRQAFLDVGGFDEDFFSYQEDVDLGFRLRLKGLHCFYVSMAIVHHVGSSTMGVNSDFALYYSHRNLVWTFFKNMPERLLFKSLPAHLLANLMYLLYYTIVGRGKVLWRAKWDAINGLPIMLKKRREIQKRRIISDTELLNAMERDLMKPYIRNCRYHRVVNKSKKEDENDTLTN